MSLHWKAAIAAGAILALAGARADATDLDDCISPTANADVAIAACNRVITSASSTPEQIATADLARGQWYYTKQQYDRAIDDFDQAIALKSKYTALAYGDRANAYAGEGQDQTAIDSYTMAIQLDPTYAAAFTGRGLLYEKAGQIDKARADYQSALAVKSIYYDNDWAHQTATQHLAALNGK
jgi:tetratricopeptide (TPR) repeat protein